MRNLNSLDRLLRALLGVILLELAYFWLSGSWQIGAYVAGGIMLATAAIRFCPLYRIFGISSAGASSAKPWGWLKTGLAWVLLIAVIAGGSYASHFFSRKVFVEDFNAMNDHYKQTLFLTGKNEREKAIAKYDLLIPAYAAFQKKYKAYQPRILKGDTQLQTDLDSVATLLTNVGNLVRTGDLQQTHLDLEKVRPVFQSLFKRNGLSMLSVALVDFHDDMETLLEAAHDKNAEKLVKLYPQVSEKLKAVEAEANDAEIAAIRKNLDELLELANTKRLDQLDDKGEALKSSFVKVYLKRG